MPAYYYVDTCFSSPNSTRFQDNPNVAPDSQPAKMDGAPGNSYTVDWGVFVSLRNNNGFLQVSYQWHVAMTENITVL